MVEGAQLRAGPDDPAEHRIHVFQNVTRGDAHDLEAFAPKQCIASGISAGLFAETMALAVHLDDQPVAKASEIRG